VIQFGQQFHHLATYFYQCGIIICTVSNVLFVQFESYYLIFHLGNTSKSNWQKSDGFVLAPFRQGQIEPPIPMAMGSYHHAILASQSQALLEICSLSISFIDKYVHSICN